MKIVKMYLLLVMGMVALPVDTVFGAPVVQDYFLYNLEFGMEATMTLIKMSVKEDVDANILSIAKLGRKVKSVNNIARFRTVLLDFFRQIVGEKISTSSTKTLIETLANVFGGDGMVQLEALRKEAARTSSIPKK